MNQQLDPLHFIGIGGSGMSGLAELAVRSGMLVQGSDQGASPNLQRLKGLGIAIFEGHDAKFLGVAKTVVVSSAISATNVELSAARKRGLDIWHRSQFLAHLMSNKQAVTVAGTHGKSTTSAMITYFLDVLGLDPSAATGGIMVAYESTARYGLGSLFVAEADESDGSFLKYRPHVGVVTNVAFDHMEFFKDQDGLVRAFSEYLGHIDEEGLAVIGWDNSLARQIGSRFNRRRLTYGFALGSDVRGFDYRAGGGEITFTAIVEKDKVPCRLKALGRHNAQNALCALAVARGLGLDVRKAAECLAEFPGVDRRMTLLLEAPDVAIYDDYAHNPGKISACINGLKEAWPTRELHVVYQPHRYSRLETMYDQMLDALANVDVVYVVPVYSAGETTTRDFSPAVLAADLQKRLEIKARPCSSLSEATLALKTHLKAPAVVLTVGAGDVWKVSHQLRDEY